MDKLKVFRIEWLNGNAAWYVDYNEDDALTNYLDEIGKSGLETEIVGVYEEDEDASIETNNGLVTIEEILDNCDEPALVAEDT